MSSTLNFTTLDVFTTTRFFGNPLAIVRVPPQLSDSLSQSDKQNIAREFNLSETVFLHEGDVDSPVKIDIFATDRELPFAGHPTIGSGWYLLKRNATKETITLKTRAGNIPVRRGEGGKVYLQVPVNFKDHGNYSQPQVKSAQSNLKEDDFANGFDGPERLVSIVKGMTFLLVQVTSEDALARFQTLPDKITVPDIGDWAGFVGIYVFYEREDGVIRTRMFSGNLEDPATGSAASTLGGWLGTKRGPGVHNINILQGVEMGRRSDIELVVEIGQNGEVSKIQLGGGAVEVMEGVITRP